MTKIRLKPKGITLETLVEDLKQYGQDYVKHIKPKDLGDLLNPPADHYNSIFKAIKVYLNPQDQKEDKPIYMVFVRNGMIHYTLNDVLTDFKIDEPRFFYGFQVEGVDDQKVKMTPIDFEDHPDAYTEWQASYNYEEIFDAFFLDGDGDLAGFVGFFIPIPE